MKRLLIPLTLLAAAVTAPSATPAPSPLTAHQDGVVGPLLVPGAALAVTIVAFNLFGDGLRARLGAS